MPERVHGDLPAVAELAEQPLLRDHDAVEEQLAELGVAGDLRHRAHVDARRDCMSTISIEMPRCSGRFARAREYAAPARELAPGDPRLLAVEHEVVVVLDGARAQRGEVGAGVGLAEALAPDLLGGQDRGDVAAALLVGAEAQQRRSEHVEADDVHELRSARRGELLVDDDLLDGRPPAAAELRRPGAAHVSGLVAAGLPRAQGFDALVERPREVGGRDAAALQEVADLGLQLLFVWADVESHLK